MVWSAYLGLPLSLEGVGAVLNLDYQKMKEERELIRYFCVPCKGTKTNGGRTRNLPQHALDKWNLFKSYNKRDVEVEMAIQQRLQKYPVPEKVWEEYHLDQEINDRGIAIDLELARQAVALDAQSRESLMAALKERTGLENPTSVIQMLGWMEQHGMKTDSLGKKNVQELLKTAQEPLRSVLLLRQKLAKSSVKKYQAMEMTACKAGPGVCSSFMAPTGLDGLLDGTSNCKIFPRTICRTYPRPGSWCARETTKPWTCSMSPSRMFCPS